MPLQPLGRFAYAWSVKWCTECSAAAADTAIKCSSCGSLLAAPLAPLAGNSAGNIHAVPWPTTRTALRNTADTFELAIAVSEPHLPAPVRNQLYLVVASLRHGLVQLNVAHDDQDLIGRTYMLFSTGQQAFGYAGDLIGTQCAVPLGA